MTEYTTIRVKRDAKQKAEERKPPEMSWSEYLASEEYEPELSVTADLDATTVGQVADEIEKRLR